MNIINKKAFTLSEVLMVIGVLGIVSLLTIPNLKNNTTSETNIATLKATYNQLETAINAAIADYGSIQAIKDSCNSGTEIACFNDKITEKLDLQLNCKESNMQKCYSAETLKNISGNKIGNDKSYENCGYAFTLSNGASICYLKDKNSYEIDINGSKKGPNILGIDVFDTYFDSNDNLSYDDPTANVSTSRVSNYGFTIGRDETAWAMTFGNIDYVKCKDQLKWNIVTSCSN